MSINVEAVGRWQSPIRRERGHIYVRYGVQVRMRRQRDTMLLLLYDWTRMRGSGGGTVRDHKKTKKASTGCRRSWIGGCRSSERAVRDHVRWPEYPWWCLTCRAYAAAEVTELDLVTRPIVGGPISASLPLPSFCSAVCPPKAPKAHMPNLPNTDSE